MDNRSKEIFDLVSHTIFNNIGYDNLTDQHYETEFLFDLTNRAKLNKKQLR